MEFNWGKISLGISIACFRAANESRSLPSTKQTFARPHCCHLSKEARYPLTSLRATQKRQRQSWRILLRLIEEINKSRIRAAFTNAPCGAGANGTTRRISLEDRGSQANAENATFASAIENVPSVYSRVRNAVIFPRTESENATGF